MPEEHPPPFTETIRQAELAHQQAIRYGKDLARIYVIERSRRQELEAALETLNAIFASTPDGLVVLTEGLAITQANESFVRMAGADLNSILGKPIAEVLRADHALQGLHWALQPGLSIAHIELTIEERHYLVSIAQFQTSNTTGWVLVFHDQTESKVAQAELRRAHDELEERVRVRTLELSQKNALLMQEINDRKLAEATEREQRAFAQALADIAAALNSTLNLPEVLERILANLEWVVPHDAADIMLIHEGRAQIERSRGYDEATAAQIDTTVLVVSRVALLHQMMLTKQPVCVHDTHLDENWPEMHSLPDIRSYIGAPIRLDDDVIGFLNLSSRTPNVFTSAIEQRLLAIADQAAIAIKNARLYQQAQELAALEERQRLARDLHDAVSQTLWSATLIADIVPQVWEHNPEKGRQRLDQLSQLTRGALAEMRALLLELRPTALTDVNLVESLTRLAAAVTSRTGVSINVSTMGALVSLPDDVQVTFYRIAQETLNNTVRHANATCAEITLACKEDVIQLTIADNGRGFDPLQIPPGHFGLNIMRERAAKINASLEIESQIGQGTQTILTWHAPTQQEITND
ncbi:MAG: GAF domain-containing protein [Chloroflexi bacterium]|nr:GAF domain-containing protein [Chloroflexota bacterium]